ncbi:MAG: hypothetical protein ACLP01_04625 [Solirubrobacteraceae bacterium]
MRVAYDARHAARGLGISTFVVNLARELVRLGEHGLGCRGTGSDGADAARPHLPDGLDPRKRTAAVIAGWRMVAALGIDLQLFGATGLGPELRDALAAEITRGTVTILDHLPQPELWRILAGALALVYPSSDEGGLRAARAGGDVGCQSGDAIESSECRGRSPAGCPLRSA